jgi:TolB-like protein/DNA-binding winged helix-turn-helix (wHTH) protein/Flp pilus assembly protein TadD
MAPTPESNVVYEFAGRRVDPVRRLLTYAGKPVVMFPRCFDALLLLIERRGELLDKEFLLGTLWPDVVVDENSLAKVISDVRRALGEGPKDSGCIATVPRRGYRFTAAVEVRPAPGGTGGPVDDGQRREVRSLAVLPFTFLNPVASDESLGLGLADALITRLGQLRYTRVRPTSSIARFASQPLAPAAAGRALEVDSVITGTIRRAGSRVRVGVQLVAVRDDAVTWAERFDADAVGALELEDSIAERVSTALTLALARGERPPEPRRYTSSGDAYEHYIRARYLIAKRTRDSLFAAIASLERAIAIDPAFALAYAGLSEAWIQLGLRAAVSQSMRPREVMPKARAAAEKALTIDESLSEAHASLGQVLFTYEWKREEGVRELLRAIDLNPNNQNAQHWYAMSLAGLGRFDEALVQIERARDIDPLAVMVNANIGYVLYRAGRIDEAVVRLRHAVAMEPTFVMSRYRLALALEAQQQYEDALEQFEAMRPSAEDPLGWTGIARIRALMGQPDEARRMLAELLRIGRTLYVPAATIADIYVALGDLERGMDYLELAIEERAIIAMWVQWDWHWDPLRKFPRFATVLERTGLKGVRASAE